jgi:peroxiredoxin-like protein
MSEELHTFKIHSLWSGDSEGDGVMRCNGYDVNYGRPEQLGGKPGRPNPEDMLLASVVACYSITFSVLAERRRLPVARVEVDAEADVIRQLGGTLKYKSIRLRPRITLNDGDAAQANTALDSAHKAEQYCVISNALRGNVEITVDPVIAHE